ncbi:MAG: N-acetyltransferase [Cyclobacteriaceae bacterium]|nr:N-acetyltransferase [Cyclobacteriaceae bacterium]
MIHPLADVQSPTIGKATRVWQYAIILKGAVIGDDCNINCHTFIENDVVIGNRVTIKPGVYVWDGITIEDDVMIGPNATFTNDKRPRSKNANFELRRTTVKRGASVGAAATLLPGITIGEFAMIGAAALVTKDVPARALVVGQPAVIVGWLNEDGTKMEKVGEQWRDNKGKYWEVINGKLTPHE